MLHIHCGDISADTLRKSGVPGEVAVWMDLLVEGPAGVEVDEQRWIDKRVRFLNEHTGGGLTVEVLKKHFPRQEAVLERFRDHDEVVLWFDACLYDQTILIRQLDWFSRRDLGATRLSLICLGEFSGIPKYKGLGELSPEQMAPLLPTRHPVSRAELELGVRAWKVFRSADPADIEAFLKEDLSALPYLKEALKRHLQQFPSVANGLNRLQQEILVAISEGPMYPGVMFTKISDMEHPPFFGDTFVWVYVNELASGDAPLIELQGPGLLPVWVTPPNLKVWTLKLTDLGREVLAGRKDWIGIHGVDRWLGGVHLEDRGKIWRWDEARQKLV